LDPNRGARSQVRTHTQKLFSFPYYFTSLFQKEYYATVFQALFTNQRFSTGHHDPPPPPTLDSTKPKGLNKKPFLHMIAY